MATPSRRAVLTGLGVLTPLGSDLGTFWAALRDGQSGVRPVAGFDASALPSRVAGQVQNFDAKKVITQKEPRKSLKVMARTVQLGVAAAHLAMEHGGPPVGTVPPERFGVEFGCVMAATEVDDLIAGADIAAKGGPGHLDMGKWGTDGLRAVTPLWMLKYLPNMPACHVSINFNAQGPNNTTTATDVASLHALGEAYRILQRDAADVFLVGGCESKTNPLSFTRHNLFTKLTRRNDTPAEAVRPYDATRDGSAMAEGAAVFALEELGVAQKRGAKILAELVAYATGFDRGCSGAGLATVIRRALDQAGISPADVDHVNGAAGGFVELDAYEARGIHAVFGTATPVFAPRGHLGYSGAASGLVELAASVLALHHGELPGTLNHATPDPACPVAVHVGRPRPVAKPFALKISTTDMGQCAVAVVRRWADGK